MILEYQIIFLTKRTNYITVFCECLFELLRPLAWKGVYIPFYVKDIFDFENTTIPYIVGLDKKNY